MDAAGVDRLSDLTDCLLHAILSRLKARQVVQTCVLSSRWRRLWLAVPCLDIDGGEDQEEEDEEERHKKLDDFVDNLLLCRSTCASSPLHTLRVSVASPRPLWRRLHHDRGSSICAAHTRWVSRGLESSPAVLEVRGIKLPSFASGTHRLTKLVLQDVILHKDFEKHLFAWLTLLQDLEIRSSDMSNLSRIESNTLKNLTVEAGTIFNFEVIAPRLASLHLAVQFRGLRAFSVTVQEAPDLVQASLRLLDNPLPAKEYPFVFQQDPTLLPPMLCRFLCSLSNVRSLELSGFRDMAQHISPPPPPGVPWPAEYQFQIMVPGSDKSAPCPILQAILDEEHDRLPMFRNLRTLVLEQCEIGDNIQTLCSFLHNTPALEKLTLKNCECQNVPSSSASNILEMGFMTSSLSLIQIQYDDRDDHEGQGTRQVDNVVTMVEKNMPVTAMIHVTKVRKN
ncbi:hypothetical protein CFC21_058529 [Triticum aestivum]|uniref:F-box domain-containing protein n=2 Tax=Triticum aestivum TaxID=4565 RepID=A0A9R1GNS2_WHEAT|nr:MEIOTIC F-BOX protein MOF-like [Triticum dicoccoides]XP_044372859.1 MEIOTIC F-BOX protein MOF-like [Triticum aestivum]KAF7050123.1 hypothetical protein CFC21_058529 [Triticum aestivum]